MHKNNDKARMKDISIILIIPFQIFFKDKISFFPLAMVSNFAHSISAIFLYLIIKKIFGSDIAILIFFIYLFSIWSFMIILDGGFQIVGQMFFLISIFFLINNYSIISLLLSGFFFTLMNS